MGSQQWCYFNNVAHFLSNIPDFSDSKQTIRRKIAIRIQYIVLEKIKSLYFENFCPKASSA